MKAGKKRTIERGLKSLADPECHVRRVTPRAWNKVIDKRPKVLSRAVSSCPLQRTQNLEFEYC
jgi:hypothetical protein